MAQSVRNLCTRCKFGVKFTSLSLYSHRKAIGTYCILSWVGISVYLGNSEVNSVRKHNYNFMLDDGIY